MATRIKVCGITRASDLADAIELGVDAVGLVYAEASARRVTIAQSAQILTALQPFVTVVALFMNNSAAEVEQVIKELPISLLQFHGDESADFCRQFALPYIKALPMGGDAQPEVAKIEAEFTDALAFLVDSHASGEAGGQGVTFDWKRFPTQSKKPIILAGGLTPENVAQAITQLNPYAVDVSSGVESAKGIKDCAKMRLFVGEVRRAKLNS